MPESVRTALKRRGWICRSTIVWSKPNPMPESVTDRPTRSHEYLFLLSKGPSYFYDQDAIREPHEMTPQRRNVPPSGGRASDHDAPGRQSGFYSASLTSDEPTTFGHPAGRNKRSVWTVATQPFSSERLGLGETEHFAVFPPKLIEPAVLAGSAARACGVCGAPWRRVVERTTVRDLSVGPRGGAKLAGRQEQGLTSARTGLSASNSHNASTPQSPEVRTVGWEPSCAHDDDTARSVVLDPFAGSGTVGVVCGWHGRDFIGIELNPGYAQMARERIALEGRPASGGKPKGHKPTKVSPDQDSLFG